MIKGIARALLISLVIATGIVASDWPQFQRDAQHTGWTPDVCKPPLTLKWTWKATGNDLSQLSPIVVKDRVYIGDGINNMKCFDKKTGQVLWTKQLTSNVQTASSDGENIFVGTVFEPSFTWPTFFSLTGYNGSTNWIGPTSGTFTPSTYEDDFVYTPMSRGIDTTLPPYAKPGWVYCFDATTGHTIWKKGFSDTLGWPTAIAYDDEKIYTYVSDNDNSMYSLYSRTGDIVWSYKFTEQPAWFDCIPTTGCGMVYKSKLSNMYAFDEQMGQVKWKRASLSNFLLSSPAVYDGKIYFGGGYPDYFYCLNAFTGNTVWSRDLGANILSSPAVSAGAVYVGTNGNDVYAMDSKDGRILWQYHLSDQVDGCWLSSPSISGNMLYIASSDSTLYAFEGVGVGDSLPLGIYARCYPNPFLREINISFKTRTKDYYYLYPGQVDITIKIYNLVGQLVRTLCENEIVTAGSHVRVWKGTNDFNHEVASGVYLCKISSNTLPSASIKLVKIK